VLVIAVVLATGFVLIATVLHASDDRKDDLTQPSATRAMKIWRATSRRGLAQADGQRLKWPFASTPTVPEGAPPAVIAAFTQLLGRASPLQLRFHDAHTTTFPKGRVWVVPGRGVICMIRSPRLASSCDTGTNIDRRGLQLSTYRTKPGHHRPVEYELLVLVPDWAKTATLRIGARAKRLPLDANRVWLRSRYPISLLSLQR